MEREDLDAVIDDIRYLAERRDESKIRTVLLTAQPADVASILVNLDEDSRNYVFELLPAERASMVLPELDDYTLRQLVPDLDDARLSEIVDEMDSDDAAEVLAELPENVAATILESIDAEDSAEVRELLQYDEETAGRIMQLELVSVAETRTIDEAIQEVRNRAKEVHNLYNIYVVTDGGVLVGLLSLKNLVLAAPMKRVRDVMNRDVISVRDDTDQEEVARVFARYDLVAVPVVDSDNRLLGRITVDDVFNVLEDETSEDIHRMAGLGDEEEYRETSAVRASRARMPWLLVGLLGGILAAFVLSDHEASLEDRVGLAFFVPVVMAMGGNSGFQSATLIIRGLATGEIGLRGVGLRLFKELRVALINGFICAAIMLPVVGFWRGWVDAAVIALSLIVVVLNAATIGALIPFILDRFNIDPSLATGPFITASNDILALLVYLAIATRLT